MKMMSEFCKRISRRVCAAVGHTKSADYDAGGKPEVTEENHVSAGMSGE